VPTRYGIMGPVTYEDRLSIATPEGVDLDLVLAGLGSRLVAAVIDYLVQGALLLALFVIGFTVGGGDGAGGFVVAVLFVAGFLIWFGYHVAFETLASGRTPGKRATGLRVVGLGGEPVGFVSSAVRNLLRLVDGLPGVYAVGAAAVLFSRRNQRLGDLAAGTLVVRERRAPLPAAPPPGPDFAVADRYAAWDVSGITAFELVTVRRFLERRWQLEPAARGRLGWELAERLRPKVAGAPPDLAPEEFLEALAEAKASRG
jgi:uncharacterized RDD family membrane protein YckC